MNVKKIIQIVTDIVMLTLTMGFSFRHVESSNSENFTSDLGKFSAMMILSIIFAIIYFSYKKHYEFKTPWWQQVRHIIRACSLLLVTGILLNYVAFPEIHAQRWVVLMWMLSMQNIMLGRWLSRYILKRIGTWGTDIVLLGNAEDVSETVYALKSESYLSYTIKRVFITDMDEQAIDKFRSTHPDLLIVPTIEPINSNEMVIVCSRTFDAAMLTEIVTMVRSAKARFAISPPTNGLSLYGLRPQYYFGHRIVLLESGEKLQSFVGRISKACLDRGGALIGLILLSPIFLVLIYKIKKDGGPAFYSQRRIGNNGQEFDCWKFRSMIVNSAQALEEHLAANPEARIEYERDFKLKNDPRITPIGHLIRRTSLDEIPQLFNVLKGEMSLVGPRPIVQAETKYYAENLKSYLAVRPGITGLWQVSGRNDISYDQRVSFDTWYVDNWSVWNDIVIIFKTIGVVLLRKGAY